MILIHRSTICEQLNKKSRFRTQGNSQKSNDFGHNMHSNRRFKSINQVKAINLQRKNSHELNAKTRNYWTTLCIFSSHRMNNFFCCQNKVEITILITSFQFGTHTHTQLFLFLFCHSLLRAHEPAFQIYLQNSLHNKQRNETIAQFEPFIAIDHNWNFIEIYIYVRQIQLSYVIAMGCQQLWATHRYNIQTKWNIFGRTAADCVVAGASEAWSHPTTRNRFLSIVSSSSSTQLIQITTERQVYVRATSTCNKLLRIHEWASHAVGLRLWNQRDTTLVFYYIPITFTTRYIDTERSKMNSELNKQ